MFKFIIAASLYCISVVALASNCTVFQIQNPSNVSAIVDIQNCPGGQHIPLNSDLIFGEPQFLQYCGREPGQNETIEVRQALGAALIGGFPYSQVGGIPGYGYYIPYVWNEGIPHYALTQIDECTAQLVKS
jgi:hypothetical protein